MQLALRRFFYYRFLSQTWYFYHKTYIKWDVIISSSLKLLLKVWIWYRCQNRIENYHQHDGEQLGFYSKVHIKTYSKMFFILQETKNPNLFDKNCAQENVKCHIQHVESWLRWIVIEQVNHYSPLIFPERFCEKVIVMYSKKMKAKCMKEDVWKSFFR